IRDRTVTGVQTCALPISARLLATAADLSAGLRGVPALPGSQVAGGVFLRVLRGATLLPVMAGSAWREIALFMLVHFAAAKRKVRSDEHTSELQSPYDLVC